MNEVIYPGPEYATHLQEDPELLAIGSTDLGYQQRIIAFRVAREAYRADQSPSNSNHYAEMMAILGSYVESPQHTAAA